MISLRICDFSLVARFEPETFQFVGTYATTDPALMFYSYVQAQTCRGQAKVFLRLNEECPVMNLPSSKVV